MAWAAPTEFCGRRVSLIIRARTKLRRVVVDDERCRMRPQSPCTLRVTAPARHASSPWHLSSRPMPRIAVVAAPRVQAGGASPAPPAMTRTHSWASPGSIAPPLVWCDVRRLPHQNRRILAYGSRASTVAPITHERCAIGTFRVRRPRGSEERNQANRLLVNYMHCNRTARESVARRVQEQGCLGGMGSAARRSWRASVDGRWRLVWNTFPPRL